MTGRCKKHNIPHSLKASGKPYCRECQRGYAQQYMKRFYAEQEAARWEMVWQKLRDAR